MKKKLVKFIKILNGINSEKWKGLKSFYSISSEQSSHALYPILNYYLNKNNAKPLTDEMRQKAQLL